jgi:hypothetical protein
MRRWRLRRRRVTTAEKNLPSDDAIEARLKAIQAVIADVPPELVVSVDETAVNWAAPPRYQYVPIDHGARAMAPLGTDEKARFTAVLGGSAAGAMLPMMLIIRNSLAGKRNPQDQSTVKVISTLQKEAQFSGWTAGTWERDVCVSGKTVHCVRPYLVDPVAGHVVISQHKAWNDTYGSIAYADLVIKPWVARMVAGAHGGHRPVIIWDNLAAHKVDAVVTAFEDCHVHVECLPPNTTSFLQVMDVAVNGPLKAAMRRRLIEYVAAS